jgi:hypothetical protein
MRRNPHKLCTLEWGSPHQITPRGPLRASYTEGIHRMSALVLDGKSLAAQTEAELLARVERLKVNSGGKTPILATILVGNDPASATYVKMKGNACRRVGMESLAVEMPASTTTEQLLVRIEELNADPDVHGILLQHPAPQQIDERACFDAIALHKDVDGVTCLGFGRMAMGEDAYGCATPQGGLGEGRRCSSRRRLSPRRRGRYRALGTG